MSYIPMGGYKPIPDTDLAKSNPDYYWGMGLTAEAVANEFKVSREEQDQFAYNSHQKAIKAIQEGKFDNQIVPIDVKYNFLDEKEKIQTKEYAFKQDEGPRADTSVDALANLLISFSFSNIISENSDVLKYGICCPPISKISLPLITGPTVKLSIQNPS